MDMGARDEKLGKEENFSRSKSLFDNHLFIK